MHEKGQAGIEALLCLAAFLMLLGSIASVGSGILEKAEGSAAGFWAKAEAEMCAAAADALYAGGGGLLKGVSGECFVSMQGNAAANIRENIREAVIVSSKAGTPPGKAAGIVVSAAKHYG